MTDADFTQDETEQITELLGTPFGELLTRIGPVSVAAAALSLLPTIEPDASPERKAKAQELAAALTGVLG